MLGVDELEAIRLADLEGLYQEEAAERMHVSRPTFGRIVSSARRKVAKALVVGMSIRIEGGEVVMEDMRTFRCGECGQQWVEPFGTGRPEACPECGCGSFKRVDALRGGGGQRGNCQ